MKKHLTLLTAAAILATVAGTTMAKNPGSINATASLDTTVQYNFLTKDWDEVDGANGMPAANISFQGSNGKLKMDVTYNLQSSGTGGAMTLYGPIFGGDAKIGNMYLGGDGWIEYSTYGKGVQFLKTVGPVSLKLNNQRAEWHSGQSVSLVGLTANLSSTTKVDAQVVADDEFTGAAVGTLTYTTPTLGLKLKAATELGAADTESTSNHDTAVLGTMTYTLPGFVLNAKAWEYDAKYKPQLRYFYAWEGGNYESPMTWEPSVWVAAVKDADGNVTVPAHWGPASPWRGDVNFLVRGDLDLKKVNDAVVSKGYAEFVKRGSDDFSTLKVGASYAPLFITDAFVQYDNNVNAKDVFYGEAYASKAILGSTVSVYAGLRSNGTDTAKKAGIKVAKTYDWLNTWFTLDKGYDEAKATPKVGFQTSVYIY